MNTAKADHHIRLLDWDSEFFGHRTARLEAATPADVRTGMAWAMSEGIECIYCLVPCADLAVARALESNDFELVDVRVELETRGSLRGLSLAEAGLRRSTEADLPALQKLAIESHRVTRFYNDGRFDRERCELLYATWVASDHRNPSATVWVADRGNELAGYVTCIDREDGSGAIGLIAVAAQHQGEGLGKRLVSGALGWFYERGPLSVSVATQGSNTRAVALYEASGFKTRRICLWYHRWLATPSPRAEF